VIVNRTSIHGLVDGIRYQRIGDKHYYAHGLLKQGELTSYLKSRLETQKSVYQKVVYDSAGVEKRFVEHLEAHETVEVYARLPP
jgi:type III restriction enzyme